MAIWSEETAPCVNRNTSGRRSIAPVDGCRRGSGAGRASGPFQNGRSGTAGGFKLLYGEAIEAEQRHGAPPEQRRNPGPRTGDHGDDDQKKCYRAQKFTHVFPSLAVFLSRWRYPDTGQFVGCSYVEIKSSRFRSGRVNRKISDCCAVICFSNRRIVPSDCSAPPGPRGKGAGVHRPPLLPDHPIVRQAGSRHSPPPGSRFGEPDDRLREAIHGAASADVDCFVASLLAMTRR